MAKYSQSIVSCSTGDTLLRDFYIMTLGIPIAFILLKRTKTKIKRTFSDLTKVSRTIPHYSIRHTLLFAYFFRYLFYLDFRPQFLIFCFLWITSYLSVCILDFEVSSSWTWFLNSIFLFDFKLFFHTKRIKFKKSNSRTRYLLQK